METLNFEIPMGKQVLDFGGNDFDGYIKYNKTFDLDVSNYPFVYIEFEWRYSLDKNLTRFLRFKIEDPEGKNLVKSSTPYLNMRESSYVVLSMDLSDYKSIQTKIISEIYVEEVEEGSDYMGIDNFTLLIGKEV